MNIKHLLPVLGITAYALTSCQSTDKTGTQMVAIPAIDFSAIDSSVRLQDDFYHHVNGQWIKDNPLKPAYSRYGTFDILRDSSSASIHRIVEELAASKPKAGTNEYRIATIYTQAMDSTKRNELGAQPMLADLKKIETITDKAALLDYAAEQDQRYGAGIFFSTFVAADDKNSTMNILHLYQASLGIGPRDYYLEKTEAMETIRQGYLTYLERICVLAGYSEEKAKRMAKNTLDVETQLALMCYSQTELRDSQRNYNIVNIADFGKNNQGFDWVGYFEKRGLAIETANFSQLDFFKKFDTWFATMDLAKFKDYLLAATISGSASALSDEFVQANFDFFGKQLSGRKEMHPRWKRSIGVVESLLGEALGQVYVKQYFSPEAKERMQTLVTNLQKALGERVKGLAWMSDATKQKALEKLNNFTVKIGYPDKWKDYSALEISQENTYYENLRNASLYAQADNLKDLGQPVDRTKWLMNPQDVNAYYMPTTNEICFPAGILQPPFFNMNADDPVNYGAIGVVIGHEMTHGFDDQGANFDKDGNMLNWWTDEDRQKFAASTAKLAEQFSKNEIAPGTFADGQLTLGENIADQGGLVVAYLAMQMAQQENPQPEKTDGLTPEQRFFIAYARLWGQNISQEEILRLTKLDPHSLGVLRVNQALKNVDAFFDAFDIKPEDKMYLAPEERVVVW